MNKKMIKTAKNIFNLMGNYIKEYRLYTGDESDNLIYIIFGTGEIICMAKDMKTLKDEIKYLK